MNFPLLGHHYAGQRMGENRVLRRSMPDGYYLLAARIDLCGSLSAEFCWGDESDASVLTAATLLYDAFGIAELARAAALPFAAEILAKLPRDEWTLSITVVIAWLAGWLGRQATQGIDERGWPISVLNGKVGKR